jgi:ceramide glucosyltransferase
MLSAEHHEQNLDSLTRHEVRWMRTLRVLRPRSFRLIFLSFGLPLAILGLALTAAAQPVSTTAWALFGTTVIARLLLHLVHRLRDNRPLFSDLWLLPTRDLLICWVWCRGFLTSRVTWRGSEFEVDAHGVMRRLS